MSQTFIRSQTLLIDLKHNLMLSIMIRCRNTQQDITLIFIENLPSVSCKVDMKFKTTVEPLLKGTSEILIRTVPIVYLCVQINL